MFFTFDLRSAYRQEGPNMPEERRNTVYGANGQLYHYKRTPFPLTNSPSAFQGTIDSLIVEINYKGI